MRLAAWVQTEPGSRSMVARSQQISTYRTQRGWRSLRLS
jgi:hypothetical protein